MIQNFFLKAFYFIKKTQNNIITLNLIFDKWYNKFLAKIITHKTASYKLAEFNLNFWFQIINFQSFGWLQGIVSFLYQFLGSGVHQASFPVVDVKTLNHFPVFVLVNVNREAVDQIGFDTVARAVRYDSHWDPIVLAGTVKPRPQMVADRFRRWHCRAQLSCRQYGSSPLLHNL